jgi:uncharacterized protein YacL
MTVDEPGARPSSAPTTADPAPSEPLAPPATRDDWAAQTADTIDQLLARIRSRTTVPLVRAARGIVFGLLLTVLGLAVVVLLAITWVRVLSYLPGGVWVAHLITGVLFCLIGAILMHQRHAPPQG